MPTGQPIIDVTLDPAYEPQTTQTDENGKKKALPVIDVTLDPTYEAGQPDANDYGKANIIANADASSTESAYTITDARFPNPIPDGFEFMFIPSVNANGTNITLSVNGGTPKPIAREYTRSNDTSMTYVYAIVRENYPIRLRAMGNNFILTEHPKPTANDIDGIIPVSVGGTGKGTIGNGKVLVGNASGGYEEKDYPNIFIAIPGSSGSVTTLAGQISALGRNCGFYTISATNLASYPDVPNEYKSGTATGTARLIAAGISSQSCFCILTNMQAGGKTYIGKSGNLANTPFAWTAIAQDAPVSAIRFFSCVTNTGNVAQKIVEGFPVDVSPQEGDFLKLTFNAASSATSPTLNINGVVYPMHRHFGGNLTNSAEYGFSANQTIMLNFTSGGWKFFYQPDWVDTDTKTDTNYGHNSFIAGEEITKYKLVMQGIDGKAYPLCIGDTTEPTKTTSTQIFSLSSPVYFWYTATIVPADGKTASSLNYTFYYNSANIQYTFNGFNDSNKRLYLVGTIEGGGFKLDQTSPTSWYTTIVPTTEDGKVYKPFGLIGDNANIFMLDNQGSYMQFKNGIFAPVGFYGL